jgi:hypothetical protein
MHFSLTELQALSDADKAAIDPDIKKVASDHQQIEPDKPKPEIQAFSWKRQPIRNSELKLSGWKRPKNAAPVFYAEPSLWVDMETGELFTKEQVKEHGIKVGPSRSLRMIRTQSVIQSLSDEDLFFVIYILKLRNRRGGLIIDLKSALDRWIAYAHPNIHSTDRSRKRKSLEKFLYDRGILANNQTFTKDFQFIGHSTKSDYIAEESEFVYALPVFGKPGCGFPFNPIAERKRLTEWIKSKHATTDNNKSH